MAKSTLPTNPTASQVRTALGLPTNVRGKLSQATIAEYNKGKRANKRYVPGVGVRNAAERKATRADLVSKGLAGKRGPLPQSVSKG